MITRFTGAATRVSSLLGFLTLLGMLLAACRPVGATSIPATVTPTSPLPSVTETPIPAPIPSGTPAPSPSPACLPLDAEALQSLEAIETQVSQLRGLFPIRRVAHRLLSQEDLRLRIAQDLLSDYTEQEAADDAALLTALGLLEDEIDLWQLYADLLSEQVAGFYDPESEEMLLVCGSSFGAVERFTYVHEFVHALQDQHFDIQAGLAYTDQACKGQDDRCLALQALLEGDASLLQEQWLRIYADLDTLSGLQEFFTAFEMPVYQSAPEYIQEELTFPYLGGLSFVRSRYLEGGWEGVDQTFRDPPHSSEHILHPERYPHDLPAALPLPAAHTAPASNWRLISEEPLGEWALRMVLGKHLDPDQVSMAAEGWGGDLLLAYREDDLGAVAFALVVQWDTIRDAHEFTTAFLQYGKSRYGEPEARTSTQASWSGGQGETIFERKSNQTLWIQAPDRESLELMQELMALPLRP